MNVSRSNKFLLVTSFVKLLLRYYGKWSPWASAVVRLFLSELLAGGGYCVRRACLISPGQTQGSITPQDADPFTLSLALILETTVQISIECERYDL